MSSPKVIAGNWKMHKTVRETLQFLETVESRIPPPEGVGVWIFPPFTALDSACKKVRWIRIGAQNMHEEEWGAYTGEISAPMLKELGVQGIIIGHSERRRYFGENDFLVRKKLKKSQQEGLFALVCVGEDEAIRSRGGEKEWIEQQLETLFKGETDLKPNFALAYEPIWAIGTGRNATPEQAQSMHCHIRKTVSRLGLPGERIAILYGGSVTPENAEDLLQEPDVDGLLIGGASLDPEKFVRILSSAQKIFLSKKDPKE